MKLMVLFMHQLQLIGIKTNLESFVTTTLMEHMLNRHQLHFFLWVSKQWGMTVNQATTFTYPIAFSSNNVLAFKQAKSNSNGNNYLMREAGIGIPNNISVSLPGTSPALSFYVFVIGW